MLDFSHLSLIDEICVKPKENKGRDSNLNAVVKVERSVSYNEHRPRKPPPDLPSLLLHGRIVYIGMPVSVGLETEGFAIYDAMMQLKNEVSIETVAVGAAIGHACLLLAAGKKGRRFMMPHSKGLFIVLQILWRGQEQIMADALSPEEWDRKAGIKVSDGL
ncbi:hypothetical protein B296_00012490 [Ensete ventricosum]|uniref:ATP-dependent Clp protease proteolytic subunit n=1 Tax=Ensete ventricosum TaxID=4639 RepID=A0A427A8T8_ENSVE|nr:hypothetical protein B296_00012490 [Ensete ventricosum]